MAKKTAAKPAPKQVAPPMPAMKKGGMVKKGK